MRNLVFKLNNVEQEIEESFVISKILSILPDYFNYFSTAWDSTPKSEKTLTNLISKLSLEETKQKVKPEEGIAMSVECDNGGEYVTEDIKSWCKAKGIIMDLTIPHSPQLNGKAERLNRTLMEKTRAVLIDSGVEKYTRGEAVRVSAYLLNRSPTQELEKTPAELWFNKKTNLSNLQHFSCEAYVKTLKHIKKLEDRKPDGTTESALLTYSEAISGPNQEQWKKAIKEEKESLAKNEVWEIVKENEASHKKIMTYKWLFKVKEDGRYKERLVKPVEELDKTDLRVSALQLEDLCRDLHEWDEKVTEAMLDEEVTEAEEDKEYDERLRYDRLIKRMKEVLENILNPKKEFGGDVLEWITFWSRFEDIHKDEDLSGSDKYQYLVDCMLENSVAQQLELSYPVSGKNYASVIKDLKKRFGRDNMLIKVYIRDLLWLVIRSAQERKPMTLQEVRQKAPYITHKLDTEVTNTQKGAKPRIFTPICRALLDSGLQVSLITKEICEKLGFKGETLGRSLRGIGNNPVQQSSISFNLTFKSIYRFKKYQTNALVMELLSTEIPNFKLAEPTWIMQRGLELADPQFHISAPIDIILGADMYAYLMHGEKKRWESVPSLQDQNPREVDYEIYYIKTYSRDCQGRYSVKLLFKGQPSLLGQSREKALARFLALERRLLKTPRETHRHVYYMPHHGVEREQSTTTKLRMDFDASAKTDSGTLLNQILETGPKIQKYIFVILTGFRTHPIAITADIEKMFRQVRNYPENAALQTLVKKSTKSPKVQGSESKVTASIINHLVSDSTREDAIECHRTFNGLNITLLDQESCEALNLSSSTLDLSAKHLLPKSLHIKAESKPCSLSKGPAFSSPISTTPSSHQRISIKTNPPLTNQRNSLSISSSPIRQTLLRRLSVENNHPRTGISEVNRKAHHAHTSPFSNSYSRHTSQRSLPIENGMSRAKHRRKNITTRKANKISPEGVHYPIISEVNKISPHLGHPSIIQKSTGIHRRDSLPTSKSPIIPLRRMSSENVLHKNNLDRRSSFQETNHQAGPTSLYASRSELKFSGGGGGKRREDVGKPSKKVCRGLPPQASVDLQISEEGAAEGQSSWGRGHGSLEENVSLVTSGSAARRRRRFKLRNLFSQMNQKIEAFFTSLESRLSRLEHNRNVKRSATPMSCEVKVNVHQTENPDGFSKTIPATNSPRIQSLRGQKTSPCDEDTGKTITSGDEVNGLPDSTLEDSPVIQKSAECRQQEMILLCCGGRRADRLRQRLWHECF
ncbi:hypothetical protein LAZ67_7001592 [Cordylochernes scorpioides]|uniref:Integrase catalytic domain-containing protein n=1 Tax=Cordylochernes scorpioides TaxID=51811 RepID=A0ABY6KMF9_9ARAC|nr:hypothetical protein LAZ67_7001592 [Cordylochernes scorpioides]